MTELTNLDFSAPMGRYDSTAIYEDDKGQGCLIRVSGSDPSIVEEQIKNLRISFDNESHQEDADNDLKVSVELSNIQKLEKPHQIKFTFGNDVFLRGIEDEGLQIITRLPDQMPSLNTAYIVGPYTEVEANINLTSGMATFSLWQENNNGSWMEVPEKKVAISGSSKGRLHHRTNPAKRFMLKVEGRTSTYYTIQGSWVVIA